MYYQRYLNIGYPQFYPIIDHFLFHYLLVISTSTSFILFSFHFHCRFYFSSLNLYSYILSFYTISPFVFASQLRLCNLLSFTFLLLLPVFTLNRTSFVIFFSRFLLSFGKKNELLKSNYYLLSQILSVIIITS